MKIISNDKDSHINKTTNLFDLLDMAETTKKEDIIRKIYKENEEIIKKYVGDITKWTKKN